MTSISSKYPLYHGASAILNFWKILSETANVCTSLLVKCKPLSDFKIFGVAHIDERYKTSTQHFDEQSRTKSK